MNPHPWKLESHSNYLDLRATLAIKEASRPTPLPTLPTSENHRNASDESRGGRRGQVGGLAGGGVGGGGGAGMEWSERVVERGGQRGKRGEER